jgi:hypothetical protein
MTVTWGQAALQEVKAGTAEAIPALYPQALSGYKGENISD